MGNIRLKQIISFLFSLIVICIAVILLILVSSIYIVINSVLYVGMMVGLGIPMVLNSLMNRKSH